MASDDAATVSHSSSAQASRSCARVFALDIELRGGWALYNGALGIGATWF
jgi:hypothetical protein